VKSGVDLASLERIPLKYFGNFESNLECPVRPGGAMTLRNYYQHATQNIILEKPVRDVLGHFSEIRFQITPELIQSTLRSV
jgi:hypothetical protein